MEPTKVITCNCKADDQDKIYGLRKRLANVFGKPKKGYKCTVCGNTQLTKEEKKK